MNNNWINNYPLFKECVEALNATIVPPFESDRMAQVLRQMVPRESWGKIDWENINRKIFIGYNPAGIIPALETLLQKPLDTSVYIEWNDASYPIIKTDLEAIIKNFNDLAHVTTEKFIFNPTEGYIIEINHGDEAYIGIVSDDMLNTANLWYKCLTILGDTTKIYMDSTTKRIFHLLKNQFGFGQIPVAWNLIDKKINIDSKNQIISAIETLCSKPLENRKVYVFWDNTTLPAVETTIDSVISNFDIIKGMGQKIWVFDTSFTYIVELVENEITIGLKPDRKTTR